MTVYQKMRKSKLSMKCIAVVRYSDEEDLMVLTVIATTTSSNLEENC